MIVQSSVLVWLQIVSYAWLFVFAAMAIYSLLGMLPVPRSRWRKMNFGEPVERRLWPSWMLSLCLLRDPAALKETEQLLRSAGLSVDANLYEMARRISGCLFLITGILGIWGWRQTDWSFPLQPVYLLLGSALGLISVLFHRVLLEAAVKRRTNRIIHEIYTLSNQLLYYSGSKMNLHSKLMRCIPYTRVIRRDLQWMINEWYQDAGRAIDGFKRRLGTDEAHSFAETLQTMRLNESEAYYQLLRDRIQDYKEKIDLDKESRKETVSYVLFVIAGLPILNTFRVFMYPWVMEGQKLFQSLY